MVKYVVGLLLLFSSLAYAGNKVVTEERPLTLLKGQEFTVSKPAVGAFAINNESVIKIDVIKNKVTFLAKYAGKALVQVMHSDGSMTTYRLEVINNSKTAYSNTTSLYKGYNFILSGEYINYHTSGNSKREGGTYRGRALLTTRVGDYGKFYGEVQARESYPTYFYVRGDYRHVYLGYGDKTLQLNPYKPTFIIQPRLRQHTAGWDGENFDLDLWSGQLSPVLSSNYYITSTPMRESLLNNRNDQFSGGRVKYKFQSGSSIYASYWYNHEKQRQIPYIGYTYLNRKLGITESITVGNTQEAPVFANKFLYENRYNRHHWTLQRGQLVYERAENGYDNLLFNTKLPMERFTVSGQLYNGSKFSPEGSPYLNFGYNHYVRGYTLMNAYSGKLGWQNSRVDAGVGATSGIQEFSYNPGKTYHNYTLTPSLSFWLSPTSAPWRWKLGLDQEFSKFEYTNGDNNRQETRITAYTKHKSGLGLSMGVGRFSFESPTVSRTGVRLIPRVEYRKDNLVLYAQGNISYVDQQPLDQNSNYILGQERYSGGLKYTYNQKHIFQASYIQATDNLNKRDYAMMTVGYTLKLGHPNKSIISLFDSHKISGIIFEDLNLNGKQDVGEPGIKGLKIVVKSDKGDEQTTITDSSGYYKISGLNEEVYSFYIEDASSYTLSDVPGNLNFRLQQSYEYNLPAVKTKNVEVSIGGNTDETIMAVVDCAEKEMVNKVPVSPDRKNFVTVPIHNKCSISLHLMGQSNISVFPISQPASQEKVEFQVTSSKVILGQVFVDKNQNGYYEFGEELQNAKVVFDKFTLTTDANGTFTSKVADKIKTVKFLRVQGRKCFLRNSEIFDFAAGKVISINCQP